MDDRLTKIISLGTTFGLLVCSVYLFAYWSSFGINILEFVGLADFIKLGIYPVIIASAAFAIGSFSVYLPIKKFDETKTLEEQNIEIEKNNKFARRVKYFLIIFLAISTIFGYFLSDHQFFWFVLSLFVTAVLSTIIEDIKYLEAIIPNIKTRQVITIMALSAFPISFTAGKTNALDILSGRKVKIISTKTIKEHGSDDFGKKGLLAGQENLKFIGAAGDFFFFIAMDNSRTYVLQYSDLHFLELQPHKTQ